MLFVGLDHSLTAFGLAAVRPDWELDFRRVRRATLTTKPGPQPARRARLADDVLEFVKREAARSDLPLSAVRVFIEGGIFMRGKADSIRSQERLAGVVEHELLRAGIELEILEQRTVRATFMGRSAAFGRGAGDAAQGLLRAVAPDVAGWDEAELDAFLLCNHALSLEGEAFITCAPQVEPEKPAKRGRAA
jgi:hypothetical protein